MVGRGYINKTVIGDNSELLLLLFVCIVEKFFCRDLEVLLFSTLFQLCFMACEDESIQVFLTREY